MNRWSTTTLKSVITLIGLAVLAFCILVLPKGIMSEMSGDFDYGIIMVGMYVSTVPFFYALYQGWKLLTSIENDQAFSDRSLKTLSRIKICALSISALYLAGMPYIFYLGDKDDAPGVVALSVLIIGTSFIVATATAVFQKLLQSALNIKSENDLTV